MREIKFRAWDKSNKAMIDIFNSERQKDWFLPSWGENFVIMQYTGLKDQNGTDIYEGDIVQVGVFDNLKCKVYYFNKMQAFMLKDLNLKYEDSINFMSQFDDYKVIGNIYENPELLE